MLFLLFLISCVSIVKRPAVNDVKTVAVVSITSNKTLLNQKTRQRISMDEEILQYVKNIVNKSPDIIISELHNVKGWTIKNPDSFSE
jgi:hypothetical protein